MADISRRGFLQEVGGVTVAGVLPTRGQSPEEAITAAINEPLDYLVGLFDSHGQPERGLRARYEWALFGIGEPLHLDDIDPPVDPHPAHGVAAAAGDGYEFRITTVLKWLTEAAAGTVDAWFVADRATADVLFSGPLAQPYDLRAVASITVDNIGMEIG